MIDPAAFHLAKALESLAGAESELANRRFNNCANRAYYACFQAAIAALWLAGVRPPGTDGEWSHSFAASQFDGLLMYRRKLYVADLHGAISRNFLVRVQADYQERAVNDAEARRAVRRATALVSAVEARERTR